LKINIQSAITALHTGFDKLNAAKFSAELPVPAILVQTRGKHKAYGWCSTKEIWVNELQTYKRHEITICAEHLARPVVDILETMLHEMVHLDNALKGIKDCSRGGTFHNKRFKEQAERHGLIVEKMPKYGYALTSLQPETEELIKGFGIDQEAFSIFRLELTKAAAAAKQPAIKYVCSCGTAIRPVGKAKALKAICQECNGEFKPEEDDD
jgi:hypothetical protein